MERIGLFIEPDLLYLMPGCKERVKIMESAGMERRFRCIGVPVRADETRSAAVCRDEEGRERVVIAARGYALIVDPVTGACRQLAFQEGKSEYPYAAISGRSGRFYTGAGPLLVILDPFQGTFVTRIEPERGEEVVGFAFAEDSEGAVYATTYPSAKLLRIDPDTGSCRTVARLDPEQKYAMSLGADRDGWVYAGIGTTAAGLTGCRVSDGLMRALGKDGPAVRGSGHVHVGEDGEVYGRLPTADAEMGVSAENAAFRWYRLRGGEAEPVVEAEVSPSSYKGEGYRKLYKDLSDGRRIIGCELAEQELVIAEPDGSRTALKLDYEGGLASLSPIAAGPDGLLYGTSNHPLHLYRYNPAEDELHNYGGKIVERGGGGNICAYAAQGPYLVGAAYAGGCVHVLDTREPLDAEPGEARNPKLVYADSRIHRPRSALAHPDGEHVLYGGFPGYGSVGGALGVLHLPSQSVKVYEHTAIVPHQSTLGLAALSGGDVIGGTSVKTPGGADPIAKEAALYRFRWTDRTVSERWVPVLGAREISLLAADANDYVYGLTSDSILFVFDPHKGVVLRTHHLGEWGTIVRQGLVLAEHNGKHVMLGLLSRTLFAVDPVTLDVRLTASLPKQATMGFAVVGGSAYYGCDAELWQYRLEEVGSE